MPIATFRGEKTLADIANKMYVRLTPKQREKAEAEILKANPHLHNLRDLPEGAIIRVPSTPQLRPKINRSLENPDVQIADAVADALTALSSRFDKQTKLAKTDLEDQISHTKNRAIKEVLAQNPELQSALESTAKKLAERAEGLNSRSKTVTAAIKQAQSELAGKRKTKRN